MKNVTKDKDGQDITYQYICTQLGSTKICKKKLLRDLKGETDKNTITVENIYIPLTAMNISSKQKYQ